MSGGRDCPWRDEGMVCGHWGASASGILFTTGREVLLTLRSARVLDPGVWGIPGGAVPRDCAGRPMGKLESAKREATEEIGALPACGPVTAWWDWSARDGSGFSYRTFVVRVPIGAAESFVARLDWESDAWGWFLQGALLGLPLHPAFRDALLELYDEVFAKPDPRVRAALRRGSTARGGRRSRKGVSLALEMLSQQGLTAFEEEASASGREDWTELAREQRVRRRPRRRRRDGLMAGGRLDLRRLFEEEG